jgi:protein SMG7
MNSGFVVDDIPDIASVSTETEDDPVEMAMRATLGGSSTDGEEVGDDGSEEVILWGPKSG